MIMVVLSFYKYKRKISKINILRTFSSNPSEKLKILFFGTDSFSLPSLKILNEEGKKNNSKIKSLEVVTSFKNPINPVRKYALDNIITVHKWPPSKDMIDFHKFNIGIVVSFGYYIPSNIISQFSKGMINLHASLLPRWRGAAPIVHAIANGDTKTGVTIMKIEPKHFDIGDILYQDDISIEADSLMPHLYEILAIKGSRLVLKTIENFPECFQEFKKQDEKLATYAPKVSSIMTEINWINMTANKIYNLYRALYNYKNLVTKFRNFNLKIIEMSYNESFNSLNNEENLFKQKCGFIQYTKTDKSLIVLCKDQTYIKITKLKLEGKKVMTALDFNNGFLKKLNVKEKYFE